MIASADGNILVVNFDTICYVFIHDNSFNVNSKIGYFLSFSSEVKYCEHKFFTIRPILFYSLENPCQQELNPLALKDLTIHCDL